FRPPVRSSTSFMMARPWRSRSASASRIWNQCGSRLGTSRVMFISIGIDLGQSFDGGRGKLVGGHVAWPELVEGRLATRCSPLAVGCWLLALTEKDVHADRNGPAGEGIGGVVIAAKD